MVTWSRQQQGPEHPDVRHIEALLGEPSEELADAMRNKMTVTAKRGVWICACSVSGDEEAPTWLLVDDGVHRPAWSRVPDEVDPLDVVETAVWVGGHTEPEAVLAWLQGKLPDPWTENPWDEASVETLEELRDRITG